MNVIEAVGLGKRYGRKKWGLRDCTLSVPAGCVTGLVGPNAAGKTTLLSLTVGMIRPTAGTILVAGETAGSRAARDLTAFVAQDAPLYQNLPVLDMLRVARNMNLRWDHDRAISRLGGLGISLKQRVGALSGGQKAQLALTIALARRPSSWCSTSRSPPSTPSREPTSRGQCGKPSPRTRSRPCSPRTWSPSWNRSPTPARSRMRSPASADNNQLNGI